ncbi:DoxX family protein [Chryseobacterium lathyri]|uniref:Oxidoreductase n=1 Tax=Chryseobacterium lathyri TaxID=395933 RepID=A0ABT9SN30_9FLAO|nr:DoxX family protein [Chryseobacterium lathyri]MDP9960830.1 putative oxidoreductase [Chryseobacterium lathyri]MDQ0065665.1 putative oxidoreductase [Chryseobacterium lathyri]
MKNNFFLRSALSVILLMHSVVSIFSGDVNDFGRLYLDTVGFSPFGLYLAWAVKLIHLFSVFLIWSDRYVKAVSVCHIFILVFGIYFVHWQNGWYVVGGGTNGIEFNILLICCFLQLIFTGKKGSGSS